MAAYLSYSIAPDQFGILVGIFFVVVIACIAVAAIIALLGPTE